ncbi:hypothetical protein M407DRAFT_28025 [Tulasnella calospora MUT 4182]|uniref:Fe2OG dioxygenase domain-containing protein n=1 Tax=Tulasnella calospora MUT 4182 TaxID=1051891 RepID=A0A0C3KM65_9AGAM|nr:hypothetical protein M407DRAFT_28025 [Tulasnella calospora MUT 4182]
MSSPSEDAQQLNEESSPEVFLSSRPPVTPHEAGTIDKIIDALIGSETFYLSGTLDLATLGVSNPTILYSVSGPDGDVQAARVISLSKPSTEALDLLHAEADPSPFGHNKELVHDESYRRARELRSDRFNLNFDPIAVDTGVLAAVSAFAAPHLEGSPAEDDHIHPAVREPELVHKKTGVQAKLYKLNSYTTGGHFKKHQDTPKAENHIGTLLFGIPTSFSGGELILSDMSEPETGKITIDWSKPSPSNTSTPSLPWVFFYSDVEHEILPVASGNRLTVAYDIYTTDTVRYRVPGNTDRINTQSIELFNELNGALKDEQFLNKGGKLAFALTYQYPAREMELAKKVAFDAILKGNDYLLFHTLKALLLTPQVRAVYQPEEFPDWHQADRLKELMDSGKPRYPADRFSSFRAHPPPPKTKRPGYFAGEDIAFFTAPTFMGIDSSRCESDDEPRIQLLTECASAEVDWELIWVKRPTKAAWAKASTFAYYGNEPDTSYTYVAGVLVVDVPALGEGARKRD